MKSNKIFILLLFFLFWDTGNAQSWYLLTPSDGLDEETEDIFFLNADTGYGADWRINNIAFLRFVSLKC